jgi:hypothetical protein
VTPARFTAETPVGSAVVTSGLPHAIASSSTMPNASAIVTDGRQNTSVAW